jgi:DNA-directed RNA polymerase specialized sigma24 family protein
MAPGGDEPDHAVESDGALLCRIAARDLGAFEILFRRYVRPIYCLALRRLRDREGAEDATWRAFTAIWRSEEGWLAFRVHAAVAELPEQERVPLELAYWEGRSPSEIAEQLGLPLGTVQTSARSALERLAVRLEEL